MAAMTAMHRVLNTTELLEGILLELPIKSILSSAQRVSTHFKQVIDGSIEIQRLLFLAPGNASNTVAPAKYHITANQVQTYWNRVKDLPPDALTTGITFNPLLVETVWPYALGGWIDAPPFQTGSWIFDDRLSHLDLSLLRSDASDSRRRMYISQPPLKIQTAGYGEVDADLSMLRKQRIEGVTARRMQFNGMRYGIELFGGSGKKLGELIDGIEKTTKKWAEFCEGNEPTFQKELWKFKTELEW